jgi:hypothetical protein
LQPLILFDVTLKGKGSPIKGKRRLKKKPSTAFDHAFFLKNFKCKERHLLSSQKKACHHQKI